MLQVKRRELRHHMRQAKEDKATQDGAAETKKSK